MIKTRLHPIIQRLLGPADDETGTDNGGTGATATPPADNPRLSAMDAIAADNLAKIEEQLAEEGLTLEGKAKQADAAATSTPTTEQTTVQIDLAPAIDQQLVAQLGREPVPVEALDGVKVKVKVDGEVREVTLHDLRRNFQMDAAAARRLQQATELLEQARNATLPPVGADANNGSGNTATQSTEKSADLTDEARRLTEALKGGDEAAVANALKEVLQRAQPAPQLNPEELVTKIVPAVRQQLSQEEALKKFAADFPDVARDPYLASIADGHLVSVLQEEPQQPFEKALQEAGKRTQAWMATIGVKPATEQKQPTAQDTKLERKQSIDTVGGLNTKATTVEQPEPTATDVIAEMRKARGLEV